jgi:hypothetical protein
MTGETDLTALLASMQPELQEGLFVFVTVRQDDPMPAGILPIMTFRESEGLTLVLPKAEADRTGLVGDFPCRWIALAVHSALHAVGLLAAITRSLADAGISVNAVSAFHHDHLFVPEARAEEAVALLTNLRSGVVDG